MLPVASGATNLVHACLRTELGSQLQGLCARVAARCRPGWSSRQAGPGCGSPCCDHLRRRVQARHRMKGCRPGAYLSVQAGIKRHAPAAAVLTLHSREGIKRGNACLVQPVQRAGSTSSSNEWRGRQCKQVLPCSRCCAPFVEPDVEHREHQHPCRYDHRPEPGTQGAGAGGGPRLFVRCGASGASAPAPPPRPSPSLTCWGST